MRLPTQSLLLKIFLWFWATAIVTAIALVLTFIFGPGRVSSRWDASLTDMARSSGVIAVADLERGGISAVSSYIDRFDRDTRLRACLFDMNGTVVTGESCASFAELRSRVNISHSSEVDLRYGLVRVALVIAGKGGREYIFATELPAGPRSGAGLDRAGLALRLAVAILVSGFVCYLLTVYLTRPIVDVSEVARQLARGSLNARASAGVGRRRDELGTLAREFNAMAARIEELVSQQRQLILDISHELRSPLARLNVALDLAKAGKAGNLPFQHMESDVMRLDEMIGRLLIIAKLNAVAIPAEITCVDLTELVGRIAESAAFEAQERAVVVELSAPDRFHVRGSAELLHSAIENVVRNAIRYTGERTTVEISLRPEGVAHILLSIRDHGPGVPHADLPKIFQPFYRVADSRDRESGGVGLGLAIADRIIRGHGGTIHAENAAPPGLSVWIQLPRQV